MLRNDWSERPVILGVSSEPTPNHVLPISPTRWLNHQSVWWLLGKESSHLKILESHCHRQLQTEFFLSIFLSTGEMPEYKSHDQDKDSVPEGELTKFSQWHSRTFSSVYSPLLFFSVFFSTIFFCFFSQVPKWVYWWSLPKLRNGQLLQYVHSLSVSAWIGACSVGAAFLLLHLPSESPRASVFYQV